MLKKHYGKSNLSKDEQRYLNSFKPILATETAQQNQLHVASKDMAKAFFYFYHQQYDEFLRYLEKIKIPIKNESNRFMVEDLSELKDLLEESKMLDMNN